jgi:hypothetical protein
MPNYSNILVEEETKTEKISEKKEEKKVEIKKKILPKNILNTRYCHYDSEEEE